MYPRFYTRDVPPAGIKTYGGESVSDCMKEDNDFKGPDVQLAFRNQKLGEPGIPLHTHGIIDPPMPSNIVFGVSSGTKNYTAQDCLKIEPEHETKAYDKFVEASEAQYHRSKQKLGRVPDGVAVIPEELKKRGFGVITKFGESAGSVIQNSNMSTPDDVTLGVSYQTNRGYNWKRSGINLKTHTFGIRGESNIDHLGEIMNMNGPASIVPVAVDRVYHNQAVPDPDPVDPMTRTTMRTMTAAQLRGTSDPATRPPAGVSTKAIEFTVGDTIRGMGLMDARGPSERILEREVPTDRAFGIQTKPNPFPNPLRGPGRYVDLGLSDEDFLKLRDRKHIVPVMMTALALNEDEANSIFDQVSVREKRDMISVSEFHQAFKESNLY
jgi:hypothetical protein